MYYTSIYSLSLNKAGIHENKLLGLTNLFDAFFNTKSAGETKATMNNKCSKQMLILVVNRNSCPPAPVTMFRPT